MGVSVPDLSISDTNDYQSYSNALERMRRDNIDGASVDPKSAEELEGCVAFMDADGTCGAAIQPSGNIVAVFKNRQLNPSILARVDLILNAVARGGDRLDCYGRFLVNTYAYGGMQPVCRVKYGRGFNPEMDAYIDQMRSAGKKGFETDPDIYFMKLRDGVTIDSIIDDIANGNVHVYSQEELDSLEIKEYEEAEKLRDDLISSAEAEQYSAGSLSWDEYIRGDLDNVGSQRSVDEAEDLVSVLRQTDVSHIEGLSPDVQEELASRAAVLSDKAKQELFAAHVTPEMQAYADMLLSQPIVTFPDEEIVSRGTAYYEQNRATRQEREAVIIIGSSASGKSTIANMYIDTLGAFLADCDPIAMSLDEYGDGEGASATHDVAGEILDAALDLAIANGDNIVYPKVGSKSSSIVKAFEKLHDAGYKVCLVYNDLPIEKAFIRNTNRYTNGETVNGKLVHRLVDPQYVLDTGNKPLRTFEQLKKEGIFDGYAAWSNDKPRESPVLRIPAGWKGWTVLQPGDGGLQELANEENARSRSGSTGNEGVHGGLDSSDRYSVGGTWDDLIAAYDAHDQGMNPRARDIEVPKQVSSKERTSQFLRSLLESDAVTDAQVEEVKEAVIEEGFATYVELPNVEVQEDVRNEIADLGVDAAQKSFLNDVTKGGDVSVRKNAIGIQLLKDATERGDKQSAMDIAAALAIAATESGRATQIFATLKSLGGAGAQVYARRLAERLNAKYAKEIASGRMKAIEVSQETMNALLDAKGLDQINEAESMLSKEIGQQLPPSLLDRIRNWRYVSMLANPTTHFRNMLGNSLMHAARGAKNVVAAGIERAVVSEDQRTHGIYRRSTPEGKALYDYGVEQYKTHKQALASNGKYTLNTLAERDRRMFKAEWLEKLARKNSDWLEQEDAFFLKRSFADSYARFMAARGITPDAMTAAQKSEAVDWASKEAWRATFRDASAVASYLNKGSKIPGVGIIVDSVIPFKKTPINILKRGADYSPVGFIEAAFMLANISVNSKRGTDSQYAVADVVDRISSGIVGSSLMAVGAFLASLGIIRGLGEEDEEARKYAETLGEQKFSLKVGSLSVDLSGIAPMTMPLYMGAALFDMLDNASDEPFGFGNIIDLLSGIADPLMEMSFMSSLANAFDSYGGYDGGAGETIGAVIGSCLRSYAGQFVPTVGGKVARILDNTDRTTKADAKNPIGGSSFTDYFARGVAQKIPGVANTLEPYVDLKGRESRQTTFGAVALDIANQLVLPGRVKTVNKTNTDRELIRLYEDTGSVTIFPTAGKKYFTANRERHNMTASQYTRYSEDRGTAAYAAVKAVIKSERYAKMSDDERVEAVSDALKKANTQTDNQWKEQMGLLD